MPPVWAASCRGTRHRPVASRNLSDDMVEGFKALLDCVEEGVSLSGWLGDARDYSVNTAPRAN